MVCGLGTKIVFQQFTRPLRNERLVAIANDLARSSIG